MAKGDGKKDKDKIKIPKRIAGVKVSKAVRKAGKQALKLAESPAVSETVAAALLAAAAALRDPPATKRGASAAAGAAGGAGQEASKLGESLRKLALDMARRTLDAWQEADSKPRKGKDHKVGNG
jgi:hypothetical protein